MGVERLTGQGTGGATKSRAWEEHIEQWKDGRAFAQILLRVSVRVPAPLPGFLPRYPGSCPVPWVPALIHAGSCAHVCWVAQCGAWQKWQTLADQDKERYQRENDVYMQTASHHQFQALKKQGKTSTGKQEGGPKRAKTAYMFFNDSVRGRNARAPALPSCPALTPARALA